LESFHNNNINSLQKGKDKKLGISLN